MKLFTRVEHKDIDALRAELAELAPLTAKVKAEKQAETLAQRQEAAAQVEKLTTERETALETLKATLTEKEAAHQAAKAALDTAWHELTQAKFKLSTESHRFTTSIDRQRTALIETADPELDHAIAWFNDKLTELRRPGIIRTIGRASTRDPFSWSKKTLQETNHGAVLAALDYCKTAIQTLESMKIEPAFNPDAVKKLKDAIPKTDVFEKIRGTLNMEKPQSIQPMAEMAEKKAAGLFKKLGLNPA